MNFVVILGGLAVLVCVALLIGLVESRALDAAWRRLAASHRDRDERDGALVPCLRSPRCPQCPVDRYLRSGQ
jgi:hypothetical protein